MKLQLIPGGDGDLVVRSMPGGTIVASGTPDEVMAALTAKYGDDLTELLAGSDLGLPDPAQEIRGVQFFVTDRDSGTFKKLDPEDILGDGDESGGGRGD